MKTTYILSFITLTILFYACQPMGKTYFVSSVGGSDNNHGLSADKPWQSLEKLNTIQFQPGDQILLKGGDTLNGNLVFDDLDLTLPGKPIMINSYGQGKAVINAGNGNGIHVTDNSGFEIKNLRIIGQRKDTLHHSGIFFQTTGKKSEKLPYVCIDSVEVSGFHFGGIVIGEDDKPIEGQFGYRNVRITNCMAYDNLHYGIYVTGLWDTHAKNYANDSVYIGYCTTYNNWGDSTFFDNHSGNGILLDNVTNGMIEYCVAYNNGQNCHGKTGGPVGIWAHSADNVIIQHCISYNNKTGNKADGGGFDFDGGVSNSIMQYNYSFGNDGAGYLIYTYDQSPHSFHHNTIRYNVSVNDGRKNHFGGIYVTNGGSGVKNIDVYNNTILTTSSGKENYAPAILVWDTENVRVFNNNLVSDKGAWLLEVGANQPGLIIRNNNYFSLDGNFRINSNSQRWNSGAGNLVKTLAQWQNESGFEMENEKSTALSENPMFRNPNLAPPITGIGALKQLDGFSLLPHSPLVDKGLDLKEKYNLETGSRDFSGNIVPSGSATDVGAFEIQ